MTIFGQSHGVIMNLPHVENSTRNKVNNLSMCLTKFGPDNELANHTYL